VKERATFELLDKERTLALCGHGRIGAESRVKVRGGGGRSSTARNRDRGTTAQGPQIFQNDR